MKRFVAGILTLCLLFVLTTVPALADGITMLHGIRFGDTSDVVYEKNKNNDDTGSPTAGPGTLMGCESRIEYLSILRHDEFFMTSDQSMEDGARIYYFFDDQTGGLFDTCYVLTGDKKESEKEVQALHQGLSTLYGTPVNRKNFKQDRQDIDRVLQSVYQNYSRGRTVKRSDKWGSAPLYADLMLSDYKRGDFIQHYEWKTKENGKEVRINLVYFYGVSDVGERTDMIFLSYHINK